jgi:Kef-type K+ transport system membrane component KefB
VELTLGFGLMIVLGWLGGALAARLRLPKITGYLLVGVALSPSVLNVISRSTVDDLGTVAVVALSIIGYAIGGSVRLDALRELGASVVSITLGQGLVAWLVTTVAIVLLGPLLLDLPDATAGSLYFPVGFVLGSIAWLTAPAVTIALIRQYRSAGPLTTASLTVVALSDVFGIIAFAFSLALAQSLMGTSVFSYSEAFALPLARVAAAIVLGLAVGGTLRAVATRVERPASLILALVLGAILLCTWAAMTLGLSAILASMVMGFLVANVGARYDLIASLNRVEDLVFIVFFVLSGMYFDWDAMEAAGLLAVVILVTRAGGKYAGAYLGATVGGAPVAVRKYVGLSLLPKAGLTIGMALLAREAFEQPLGDLVFNGLLAATLINMLLTPPLAKYALFASGEPAANTSTPPAPAEADEPHLP